jgi:TolA-binding protein
MEEPVDPVSGLLAEVAAVQRAELRRASVLDEVRARVAAAPPRPRLRLRFALPTVLACAAAAALVAWTTWPPALSFRTSEPALVTGAGAGSVLAARDDAELALDFSDGSRVALAPAARLAVQDLASRGATLALERGRAELRIVHRARTRWVVKAGPAEVRVTGTRFWIGWDPALEELSVEMREGSVEVSGLPGATGAESLRAGQVLRASPRRGGFEIVDAVAAAEASRLPAAAPATAALAGAPPAEAPPAAPLPAARARHVAPVPATTWRELAGAARYGDALRAATRAGFASACDSFGAEDLLLLGDVARLAGDPDRAEQAYRAARRRFPSVDRSAFALGLTAFEQRRQYREAASWFATYLGQYPNGALAREAAGRLVEARQRAGDDAGARAAARDYLGRYPAGPHAGLARELLAP